LKSCVILGANGWLGKSTLSYIVENYSDCEFTLVSSQDRLLSFKDKEFKIISFEKFLKIEDKEVDVFFNYAFLTGNRVKNYSNSRYLSETEKLIEGANQFINKNMISKVLLSSSGAIYNNGTKKENVYSLQKKKQEEELLNNCSSSNTIFLIARIFGLFANYYNVEYEYAFSSFIEQAKNNKSIKIKSEHKVVRSYLVFKYLLDYFLQLNESQTIDAWNVKLDIFELAKIICDIFNVDVELNKSYFKSEFVDDYSSKDTFFKEIMPLKFSIHQEIEKIIKFSEKASNKVDIFST